MAFPLAIFLVCLIGGLNGLHLTYCPAHFEQNSEHYRSQLQSSLQQLESLQHLIDTQLSFLDPYNQTSRIEALQNSLFKDRKDMYHIYASGLPDLNGMTYYCHKLPYEQQNAITESLNNIATHSEELKEIAPIKDESSSLKNEPEAIQESSQKIGEALSEPGIVLSHPPHTEKVTNPAGEDWYAHKDSPNAVSEHYQKVYGTNQELCPEEYPYVDKEGRCMNCPNGYDLETKSCQSCTHFDKENHVCYDQRSTVAGESGSGTNTGTNSLPGSPSTGEQPQNTQNGGTGSQEPHTSTSGTAGTTNPYTEGPYQPGGTTSGAEQSSASGPGSTSPYTNNPSNNQLSTNPSAGTGPTNPSTFNPSVNQPSTNPSSSPGSSQPNTVPSTPTHHVTNPNSLSGILLPEGQTIQSYKQALTLESLQPNTLPCPEGTPFFDGTKCIWCPSGQYFATEIKTCQTCPSTQTYDPSTFHCTTTHYHSNPQATKWVSVATAPSQVIEDNKKMASSPDAKSCPIDRPFFDGNRCISCAQPTPLFSYDALKCTSCSSPTVFDEADNACVSPIQMQTNPTSPDLIYGGRSLNQWQFYYYNNQTANPQLADCPASHPYFDGITCITCPTTTPYFNLETRKCQDCPALTSYDEATHECLSTSGNIVTQAPTITKMAAGIFG